MTKVKRVEVESEDLKREFEEIQGQVSTLQQENRLLQADVQQGREELNREREKTRNTQTEVHTIKQGFKVFNWLLGEKFVGKKMLCCNYKVASCNNRKEILLASESTIAS